VAQEVAGSKPVTHPKTLNNKQMGRFSPEGRPFAFQIARRVSIDVLVLLVSLAYVNLAHMGKRCPVIQVTIVIPPVDTLPESPDSPLMAGSKPPSASSGQPETLRVRTERLRQDADDFHRSIENALRTAGARIDALRIRQAKRRQKKRTD
jgi:hypothetical protein